MFKPLTKWPYIMAYFIYLKINLISRKLRIRRLIPGYVIFILYLWANNYERTCPLSVSGLNRHSSPPTDRGQSGLRLWNPISEGQPTHAIVQKTSKLARIWPKLNNVIDLEIEDDDGVVKHVPSEIQKLRGLRSLRMAWTDIKQLPEWLATTRIKYMSLRDNKLLDITALRGMRHLVLFDMMNNQVRELPEGIGELTCLQILHVSGNNLNRLPNSLGRLRALKDLQCSGNRIAALPDALGDLQKLFHLDVSFNRISQLPLSLGNLKSLVELRATGNLLRELPPSTVDARSLRHVFLATNKFTMVPVELSKLPTLTTLNMKHNAIENMHSTLTVATLLLDHNRLTHIPNEVFNCPHLEVLSIRQNGVTQIPPAIAKLKHIKALYLDENKSLNDLPDDVSSLLELRHISITETSIHALPVHFDSLRKLSHLELTMANFTPQLREAYGNGLDGLMEYIREERERGQDNIYANTEDPNSDDDLYVNVGY